MWASHIPNAQSLHAASGQHIGQFSSVQSLSRVWLLATSWIAARQASLSITNSQSSLRLTSIESVMPSSHLILCHPFSSCPQSLPASQSFPMSQLVAWGGQSTGVSALASFLPKNTHPGLISFRMDWLELLAVQGTLKSLLQHHSSKASILGHSTVFTVQLSHPYTTTGKTIALTRRTFVGKVMSLLLNMLSRLVITFNKYLNQRSWPGGLIPLQGVVYLGELLLPCSID